MPHLASMRLHLHLRLHLQIATLPPQCPHDGDDRICQRHCCSIFRQLVVNERG